MDQIVTEQIKKAKKKHWIVIQTVSSDTEDVLNALHAAGFTDVSSLRHMQLSRQGQFGDGIEIIANRGQGAKRAR